MGSWPKAQMRELLRRSHRDQVVVVLFVLLGLWLVSKSIYQLAS